MRLGALIGPVGPSPEPRALAEQASALEEEGFDGLWELRIFFGKNSQPCIY